MRTHIPAQPYPAHPSRPSKVCLCIAALLAASILLLPVSLQATTQKTTPHKSTQAHKRGSVAKPPAPQPSPEPVAPPTPPPPDWPANDHPADATVVWNSQGLRIDATNSSLSQILKEVSTVTGTKVEGLGADQRIFGTYGPGRAREVLIQLLDGSGYNVLMIGEQGQGTPRSIVLSTRQKGSSAPQVANYDQSPNDDNVDVDEQPQQPQPPPPSIRNGFVPGAPPRTPQQIMQEMQQRQLQQQQMPPGTQPQ